MSTHIGGWDWVWMSVTMLLGWGLLVALVIGVLKRSPQGGGASGEPRGRAWTAAGERRDR